MPATVIILILLLTSAYTDGSDDQAPADSVIVENVTVTPGEQAMVKIWMVNSEELGAVSVPLVIRLHRASFDSISFVGSRIDFWSMKPTTITAGGQMVIFGAVCMMQDYLAPGKGLLATLYIKINDTAGTEPILVDSTSVHPASLLFAKSTSETYKPAFSAGKITVKAVSETADPKNR